MAEHTQTYQNHARILPPFHYFVMPILFALIFTGLSNIQDDLENPFDGIGKDDVAFDPDRYMATLDMALSSKRPAR